MSPLSHLLAHLTLLNLDGDFVGLSQCDNRFQLLIHAIISACGRIYNESRVRSSTLCDDGAR